MSTQSTVIAKYPLDLSGSNPNNLIEGEPHVLNGNGDNRAIVPNYGAFYASTLIVRDADTGKTLTAKQQYQAVQLYEKATETTGMEVCSIIVVTDTAVSDNVTIDYQVVGGEFSNIVPVLQEMLANIDLDGRTVHWGDVIGKPENYPPAPHLHDAGDIYGFEYLIIALDDLRHAITVGQQGAMGELRQYIELIDEYVKNNLADYSSELEALQTKYNDFYQEYEAYTTQNDQNIQGLQQTLSDLNTSLSQFKTKVNTDLDNLSNNLDSLGTNFNQHVQAFNQYKDSVNQTLSSLSTSINSLSDKVDNHIQDYDAHVQNFDQFKTSIQQSVNSVSSALNSFKTQTNTALSNRYTKTEADDRFASKTDTTNALNDRYTKSEADDRFASKTDTTNALNDRYTKSEADGNFAPKVATANALNDRFTKEQSDARYLQSVPSQYLTQTEGDNRYAPKTGGGYLTEGEADNLYMKRQLVATGTVDLSQSDVSATSDFQKVLSLHIDTGAAADIRTAPQDLHVELKNENFAVTIPEDTAAGRAKAAVKFEPSLEYIHTFWSTATDGGVFLNLDVYARGISDFKYNGGTWIIRWNLYRFGYNL